MQFDSNNKIVKLCARGIEMEATQPAEAGALFLQAWDESTTDLEKFIAAHYVARHQTTTENKLNWDKVALEFALKINDNRITANYPSLYLNIAKCYEDIQDFDNAEKNYQAALVYEKNLPCDGYGQMIGAGIRSGIERISAIRSQQ